MDIVTTVGIVVFVPEYPGVKIYIPGGEFQGTYLKIFRKPFPKLSDMVEVTFNSLTGTVLEWKPWSNVSAA